MLLLPRAFEPVNPSSEQARRWLRDELAKTRYHRDGSLLQRVADWFVELWHRLTEPVLHGTGRWSMPVLLVLAVLVLGLLGWVLPKVRRERRAPVGAGGVLQDPTLGSRDYRERAERALREGRFGDAALDWFRATAREAADRTVLDDEPGRTAHEVSVALARSFPGHAVALVRAAETFDAVRYGGQGATRAQAEQVRRLDREISGATPDLSPRAAGATPSQSDAAR